MSNNQQGFPQINTPFTGPNGTLNQAWYRLLITLWNRTGGASNQTTIAGTYSGEIRAFGATSAVPSGWLACDGAAVSRSGYPSLFSAIGTTWGSGDGSSTFNVPNLLYRMLLGSDSVHNPGSIGGAPSLTLLTTNLPAHSHGVADPGHTHTVTDPGHAHTVTDPGHLHTVTDPGHTHTVTDPGHVHAALVAATTNTTGANTDSSTSGNTGSATTGVTVNSATTGLTVDTATTGATVNTATTGVTANTAATGITTTDTGSGTGFSILPPYGIVVWAIKT